MSLKQTMSAEEAQNERERDEQETEEQQGLNVKKTLKFDEVNREIQVDAKFMSWGVGETIKVRFLTEKPVHKVQGESKKKTPFWKYAYQVFDLDTNTEKTLILWESHIRKIEPYWKEGKYSLKMTKLEKDINPIIPFE